jgi:hypothetical protein
MIEVYLFHVMFAVQILVVSILLPRRLQQRVRQQLARTPPDPRGMETVERTLGRYRLANIVIAVIGLILMGSLFSYMRRADWDDGPVEAMTTLYLLLQFLPLAVLAFIEAHLKKLLRSAWSGDRRKATLQRRGLFDFVSPVAVVLTLLCYPLIVALILYIQRDPFEGFAGHYLNISIVTMGYAVTAFFVHYFMYRKKNNPLQTHAEHMQEIGLAVKAVVYSCLGGVLALMTNFSMVLLDRQRLEPLAQIIYFVVIALWIYKSMYAPKTESKPGEMRAGASH